jgi:predicted dinucleotide-binding enzyme
MTITIVGTGNMARAIARRALAGGHRVTFVGTHLGKAADVADELAGEGDVTASETVEGDIVVLAVPYTQAPHVVRQHADALDGKTVIDITNPVDIARLEPLGSEYIGPFGSGAEAIADAAPDGASVVKAFNTTFAGPLLAGRVGRQPLDVFIAGDDEGAKALVARLARDGGLRPIDAGVLARARELEAVGYLHMVIQPSLGADFGSAIVVLPDSA